MTEAAVSFAGNLTDDPEVRYTEGGIARAMFRVAISGRREQEPSFITVIVWRDQAEHAAQSLSKGSRVVVVGRRLQQRSWTAEDGTARSVVEVVAQELGPACGGPRPRSPAGSTSARPKTRASRRTVSLPRVVTRELDAHLAGGGDPDDHVFTAPQGGTLRIVAFRNRIWRPATEAAGLTGLRIHDLRHTAVALWIAAGASPKEVAVRAGHTSVSFTLDRYGHLYPEADTRLRDRLDTLHASARPPEGVVVDLLGQDMQSQRGADMQ
jgi:single stranded DNA-binding protein